MCLDVVVSYRCHLRIRQLPCSDCLYRACSKYQRLQVNSPFLCSITMRCINLSQKLLAIRSRLGLPGLVETWKFTKLEPDSVLARLVFPPDRCSGRYGCTDLHDWDLAKFVLPEYSYAAGTLPYPVGSAAGAGEADFLRQPILKHAPILSSDPAFIPLPAEPAPACSPVEDAYFDQSVPTAASSADVQDQSWNEGIAQMGEPPPPPRTPQISQTPLEQRYQQQEAAAWSYHWNAANEAAMNGDQAYMAEPLSLPPPSSFPPPSSLPSQPSQPSESLPSFLPPSLTPSFLPSFLPSLPPHQQQQYQQFPPQSVLPPHPEQERVQQLPPRSALPPPQQQQHYYHEGEERIEMPALGWDHAYWPPTFSQAPLNTDFSRAMDMG